MSCICKFKQTIYSGEKPPQSRIIVSNNFAYLKLVADLFGNRGTHPRKMSMPKLSVPLFIQNVWNCVLFRANVANKHSNSWYPLWILKQNFHFIIMLHTSSLFLNRIKSIVLNIKLNLNGCYVFVLFHIESTCIWNLHILNNLSSWLCVSSDV